MSIIGYRTKKGNITCSDCGHEWHSDSGLCDTLEGCTCPKCHAELKVQDTRRRIYKETQNFSVITTCKGYQVIRVAQVRCESRKGEPMRFYCHEVVQRWISPDGKVTYMALLRGFLFCYCDVWALGSDMEVRPHNSLYDDVVARSRAYPRYEDIAPHSDVTASRAISTASPPCVFSKPCFQTQELKPL